jgi:uncharacterized membrane protein YsdA (DUF1294 family)
MSNDKINNVIILRVISAYLSAFIAYALGIWLGTLFGNSELQTALPRFIVKDALPAVSAAFFGNIFCLYIFHLLYPIKKRGAKAFLIMVSILTFIAVISGAAGLYCCKLCFEGLFHHKHNHHHFVP